MLEEETLNCPYCGAYLQILLDISGGDQHYFEDCQVCCRPILIHLVIDEDSGTYRIEALREDE